MMNDTNSIKVTDCSFCGKLEKEVFHLIEGPGCSICDECIELSSEIIADKRKDQIANRKVKSVYFFQNGNIVVYDYHGNQIADLQAKSHITVHQWKTYAESLGYDLTTCVINSPNW